jgi:hypothetical protein
MIVSFFVFQANFLCRYAPKLIIKTTNKFFCEEKMAERYIRNDRTRVKFNFPSGSDISGAIRNIESSIINDGTYVSELAGSFSNSTGIFQSLVTDSITGGTAYFDSITGGNVYVGSTVIANGFFNTISCATTGTFSSITGGTIYGATGAFGELIIPSTGVIATLGSIYYDLTGTGAIKVYDGSTWRVFYHG